jgi:hypothetical protein
MGMPAAIKMQRYRERQRTNRICLLIEVDREPLADMLREMALVDPLADDDADNLGRAVERLIAIFIEDKKQ